MSERGFFTLVDSVSCHFNNPGPEFGAVVDVAVAVSCSFRFDRSDDEAI
jgi:hypothetical protein